MINLTAVWFKKFCLTSPVVRSYFKISRHFQHNALNYKKCVANRLHFSHTRAVYMLTMQIIKRYLSIYPPICPSIYHPPIINNVLSRSFSYNFCTLHSSFSSPCCTAALQGFSVFTVHCAWYLATPQQLLHGSVCSYHSLLWTENTHPSVYFYLSKDFN